MTNINPPIEEAMKQFGLDKLTDQDIRDIKAKCGVEAESPTPTPITKDNLK